MKPVQWLAALCLVLVACSPSSTPADTTVTTPDGLIEIVLENGEPVGGAVTLEVEVGGLVEFRITSDHDDELHVHGLDHYFELPAGEPVKVSFIAEAPGVFEIEGHHRHLLVVELVVR